MRIGIDARFYGPEKQKGLGRYVQELVRGLEEIDTDYQFVIFLRRENWNDYIPRNNFVKVLADYRWYTLAEQIFFPFLIWRKKIDLMHFPHFNIPVFCPVDFVVTIHDLLLNHFPTRRASTLGPVSYWIKNKGYHFVIGTAIKKAKKIIAVSEYTKKDILDNFKVSAGKIEVIYEGVSIVKKDMNPYVLEKYGIVKPYLLYVGNAYPHKNLERLISAFNELEKLQLVLVGQLDYFYKRLKKTDNVIFTDFVSDRDLSGLYQSASLYVFPSLYEGFGLPPLEAMACGLPVVSSNASCLPEVLGKAAVYFDPENVADMIDKIKLVLNNERKELISAGYEQVKKYSWQEMIKQIFNIYIRGEK